MQLLKNFKKSFYAKDNLLLKLINVTEENVNHENKPPTMVD